MERARLEELQRWWALSIEGFDTPFEAVGDYARRTLDLRIVDATLVELGNQLHTCKAQCPAQLRQWAYRQIDKRANANGERSNAKPFPPYEQHGNRCFIPLQGTRGKHYTWIIPAEFLMTAQKLWPVHVRHFTNGKPFVARKQPVVQRDGTRRQRVLALHRFFVDSHHEQLHVREIVEARDGNYLNWCDGNLRLRDNLTSKDIIDMSLRKSSKRHFPRRSDTDADSIADPSSWTPAKPMRIPPQHDPNRQDDVEEWHLSEFDEKIQREETCNAGMWLGEL